MKMKSFTTVATLVGILTLTLVVGASIGFYADAEQPYVLVVDGLYGYIDGRVPQVRSYGTRPAELSALPEEQTVYMIESAP